MANIEKQPSTDELVNAHDHMWSQIFGFVSSMCLKCAVELGIPDILHNEGFTLTPAYRPFLIRDDDDKDSYSMVSYIEAVLCSDSIDPMINMSRWFRTSDSSNSPFSGFHGRTLWEFFAQNNQKMGSSFREGMASDDRLVSRIVPKECKTVFEGLEVMVDVGGSNGYMAKAITNEFPNLKCIVLDLPHVVEGLKGDDRVSYVGGSMFESIPPCDAVFFKFTLHNWNDDDCLKILGKCREAIKHKGGKVIIIDVVLGDKKTDDKATETQLIFDMLELFYFGAKERTEKEWAKLFSEAGFTSYKITPLLGIRSLIEVFP